MGVVITRGITQPVVCVVIHDVSIATWPQCRRLLDAVAAVDRSIRMTLLVVPRYHHRSEPRDTHFVNDLSERLRLGDELALHGYYHLDQRKSKGALDRIRRRWYTAGEAEFAGLSFLDARARLVAGRKWFAARNWPVDGFVAPAWLLNDASWQALKTLPFSYTTTLSRFYTLPDERWLPAPTMVYSVRSTWRRSCSRWWNDWLAVTTPTAPLIRMALHPVDAKYPKIILHWQHLLTSLLKKRTPMTKAQFARRIRAARETSVTRETTPSL